MNRTGEYCIIARNYHVHMTFHMVACSNPVNAGEYYIIASDHGSHRQVLHHRL